MVHVPSVKGRPARDAPVTYGEDIDTCPVRCRRAHKAATLAAGAAPGGPAFLPVDQWGTRAPRVCRRTVSAGRSHAARSARA